MLRSTSACIASLALVSCGGLASGDWRGEPLFSASGTVIVDPGDPGAIWPEDPLRVAVFWAGADGEARLEQSVAVHTEFPARYELTLYSPPPESVRFPTPWAQGRVAVGVPLLYLDHNGNERWDMATEPISGGAAEMAIVYAETNDSEWGFRKGFQTVWIATDVCSERVPIEAEMFPTYGEPLDLYVGEYWHVIRDWNCDGSWSEWEEACPPADAWLCEDPFIEEDPFLEECAQALCF